MTAPAHGGDLAAVGRRYGVDPAALLDFSANLNPLGPPPGVHAALEEALHDDATIGTYPPRNPVALREAIARRTGLGAETIAIGNGGAALLDAAIRTLAPKRVLVPQPAFSEYARAVTAARAELLTFDLLEREGFRLDIAAFTGAIRLMRPDLCIVTNPHNPSGALASRDEMLALIDLAAEAGIACIVDEAFVDYAPAVTIADRVAGARRLVVLRSLTKFYALAGMRVGYALAPADLRVRIEATLPSWPITTLAAIAATAAIADDDYARETLAATARDRSALRASLAEIGIRAYPSAANFLLIRLPDGIEGKTLADALIARHGIVVRLCDDYRGLGTAFIRVAVRDERANGRLAAALRDVLPR